uniref:Large ribosomal subunit protein eL34 n=1 Tax=Panagrolaimus sp. JU765 TaxID=591449 RepID=A0AC34QLP8_9BILA
MVQRCTYRRRTSYNTTSNKRRIVKTPGGKNVFLIRRKKGTVTKCGDTKKELQGIPETRGHQRVNMGRAKLSVSRAYGGTLSHNAVRTRIVRAFLIEEQKIANQILKQKAAK